MRKKRSTLRSKADASVVAAVAIHHPRADGTAGCPPPKVLRITDAPHGWCGAFEDELRAAISGHPTFMLHGGDVSILGFGQKNQPDDEAPGRHHDWIP